LKKIFGKDKSLVAVITSLYNSKLI